MTAPVQTGEAIGPRKLVQRLGGAADPAFSICVMLTDWAEYGECMASFRARGFDEASCEFLVMDNSAANRGDAYVTLNEFLQAATGRHVVICHQDVVLLDAGREQLEARLDELYRIAPDWAVCGNAGMDAQGWPAIHINERGNLIRAGDAFPCRVGSLDENLIIVRREANLALSRDLGGFHHYGTDICIIAEVLGWKAYAIDFLLHHKSSGKFDASWETSLQAIGTKFGRAFAPRWVTLVNGRGFPLVQPAFVQPLWKAGRAAAKLVGWLPRGRDLYSAEKMARRRRRRSGS